MLRTVSTVTSVHRFCNSLSIFSMVVSILSIHLVTVLFINLAVVLKRCFRRVNTCLCELIECAGQESFDLGIFSTHTSFNDISRRHVYI